MADEELSPEEEGPLDEEERELLHQDLVDVQSLKELLGPKAIKGVVFYCPDCDEDHYLAWDLLAGNLKELLAEGESPVHEPAFDPDPDEYVSWDYARGYLDGYESFETEEIGDITNRLILALRDEGWPAERVKGLLATVELDVPAPPSGE
ncbi:MAG: hypothetical protein QOG54_1137 [Actinomycetota bacterium]|jgi:hypothetical protein|nr:hypothetical protein [Actinomycetota bacterium]